MKKKNVLVFPCGSEIGLEIHRSLCFSTHFELIGASSIDDHGRYVYENYVDGLPFVTDEGFLPKLQKLIEQYQIDAIYPAMDTVLTVLAKHEQALPCKVITSSFETTEICLSKSLTYRTFQDAISIAKVYSHISEVEFYPVFIKPDIGYGSRGARLVSSAEEARMHLNRYPESVIMEYLPGREYTIDCFTNRHGELLFSGVRIRNRISNGISVNTFGVSDHHDELQSLARKINQKVKFRGAWFFQVKEDIHGRPVLLEVASRLGGSSSLFRNLGVNFALLSLFDAFDLDVKVFHNNFPIELDRALSSRYKITLSFETVYVDFDDCLLLGDKLNTSLIKLLYQFLNDDKKLILITKHEHDIHASLKRYKIAAIFDEIIHLEKGVEKYRYMRDKDAIFIDDSYAERREVHQNLGIPVFAPDNIECLYH